ncbi:MAG: REP-associated tyrosine transposase [Rhodanobacteraceae bacterium]
MVLYRRNRVPGASYFFTITLRDRSSRLLVDAVAELRVAYASACRRLPFETIAVVVLPDHLHAVWRLPEGDAGYSGRWRAIKAGFVRNLRRRGFAIPINEKGEANVWQRRFWEHTIRNEIDLHTHIDYVHWNPVKHGDSKRVCDWPYSSFHGYVRDGILANNWGGTTIMAQGNFGE